MKITKILIIAVCFFSCKKDEHQVMGIASVKVINTAIDLVGIKVNTNEKKVSYAMMTDQVLYGANKFYYAPAGVVNINVVNSMDTTMVLFNRRFNLKNSFYTMYIVGKSTEIDTIFREEVDFPFIKTDISKPSSADSIVNVRFVNLSPNSPRLSVNVRSNPVNELTDLSYKTITSWNGYTAKLATTAYVFEIRNAETKAILLSYSFNATSTNRFKNVSLIIKGLVGTTTGVNAFNVFPANYF